ncbi:hypothetical protein HanLR1_Chr08g0263611 [Helianthus annuus]|uniref:Putative ribosomal protein L34Ae n=1 Tax=Helianthus annuus TaxID=4232 RepID=A0A251U1S2_HELAN|nr:hypothetical protein HanHA89_Chr08g0281471 [Helianthus annuus]KAJ0717839.1 hypothetical protein HanLR1_Chr08g0263611 [Helianthus annuus]
MATHMLFILKSYFIYIYESFPYDLVQQTMMKVCSFIWVLVWNFVLSSFRHLIEHLAGSRIDDTHERNLGPLVGFSDHQEDNKVSIFDEFSDQEDNKASILDGFCEEEQPKPESKPEFTFGFRFQMKEEDLITYKDTPVSKTEETGDFSNVLKTNTSKYQFVSVKDYGGFVEEPKSGSFTVHESFVEPPSMEDNNFIIKQKKKSQTLEEKEVKDEVQELHEKKELHLSETRGLKPDEVNWLGEFISRNDSFDPFDYHPESDDSSEGFFSISPQDVDSVIEPESEILDPSVLDEFDDDYIELEPNLEKDLQKTDSFAKHESDSCVENSLESETEQINGEDDDDDDVLMEHQELIDQMKTELRNARTGGLPTILEESETSRVEEDYKPLQINEKLEHRDQMGQIQKFYKSYSEKMRKLDVLNYQTLQAINFLRMKHPDQTNAGENASLSAIKSVLLPSLWPCKLRRIYADPTLKSITELHKDLEIVYVGQACLSWEMLHWQYKKVKDLQLYDLQGYRSYNQVAIEFQQFHVLLRRFTEDELFQGPRVQNYTKQRCNVRGLLQVPAIKDDNLREKKARKKEEGDAVSISTMAKMIKESMMVFWEFLHTDKDTTNLFLTIILQGSKAHLQDPADSDLFTNIKTIHQKKERRLKDMLRTGNCIVKKFQKQQETILDQHMFVSQVELRLVSRVLSLPRLSRDQLVWCQSKLNNIRFVDRKIQVEDSLFLLFPC